MEVSSVLETGLSKKKWNPALYTPKLNGVAERKNKTIVDMAKFMLKGHDDRKEHL